MDLKSIRNQINAVDKEISDLFEKRMNLSTEVAKYKIDNNMPVFDAKREKEVIDNNVARIKPELKPYYKDFLQELMDNSKKLQYKLIDDRKLIHVISKTNTYPIYIINNSLDHIEQYLELERKVLIITDTMVPSIYSKKVYDKCKEGYIYRLEAGEKSKNINEYQNIQNILLENNFTRHDAIVAVGGGVCGDLAGFVASTYMRGITFYNIPTTLLSMVDSSIGGKTAIDFSNVKNVIGSFYPPYAVVIDPTTLNTLDKRQFNAGMSEVIKMAISCDKDFFEELKNTDIAKTNINDLIYKAIMIKKMVVEEDEKELGLRKVLNFGHTIGHAFEAYSKGSLLHGEAVALGMRYFVDKSILSDLDVVLKKYNLDISFEYDKDECYKLLAHDKKAVGNNINIVYVPKIGSYEFRNISIEDIYKLL